jgi:acetyl/propionyl-CoA carboxylase alpha subunit
MIKAIINQKEIIEVDGQLINGSEKSIDIQKINDREYSLLINNESYKALFVSYNAEEKKLVMLINGKEFEIQIQDKTDLLLQKMGLNNVANAKQNSLKAPMPGLIRQVNVSEGQEVKKGDVLIVLEAMKMENALKAAADAVVKKIVIVAGQTVEKSQLLIELA